MPLRHKHSVTENPVELVGVAAIAAAIGATIAMLLTPRSGGQVRRGLGRRAQRVQDDVKNRFNHDVEDSVDNTADNVQDRLQSTATKVADDVKSTAAKIKKDTKATSQDAISTAKTIKKDS